MGLADRAWLEHFAVFYQSQGYLPGTRSSSNDCGPAAAAMLMNYWRARMSLGASADLFAQFRASLRPVVERVPALPVTGWKWLDRLWLPWRARAGASAPWGLVRVLRREFSRAGLKAAVGWRSRCSFEDLNRELAPGNPCAALLIWPAEYGNGGHWVVVIGYSPEQDCLYLLDPDPAREQLPGQEKIRRVEREWFERYWGNSNWWSRLLGLRRVLLTVQLLR